MDLSTLLATPGVTLVDFTAAWCAPCRQLTPILHQLADEYRGRARVVAVDVDDDPAVAQAFRVTAMPTVVLLRDGAEVGRFVGLRPKRFVVGVLDRALDGDVAIAAP
jgi:thioredoxin 1